MSEKYRFQGNNSLLERFLAQAAIGHKELYYKENWTPGEPLDISLRMNGVEVSFLKTMELFSFYEKETNVRAADLVKSKSEYSELLYFIQDYEYKIKEKLRQVFNIGEEA